MTRRAPNATTASTGSTRSSVHRWRPRLPPHVAAVHEFDLERHLDQTPEELPYGRRRLVGIARTVASGPSVVEDTEKFESGGHWLCVYMNAPTALHEGHKGHDAHEAKLPDIFCGLRALRVHRVFSRGPVSVALKWTLRLVVLS